MTGIRQQGGSLPLRKKVYPAGPMTGIPHFNFPAFDAVVANLEERGYEVVPPADLNDPELRKAAMASATGDLNDLPRRMTWGAYLANDVRMIADDGIEAIVVMPGWSRSRGSRLETFVGRALCGLKVLKYPHLKRVPLWRLAIAWVLGR